MIKTSSPEQWECDINSSAPIAPDWYALIYGIQEVTRKIQDFHLSSKLYQQQNRYLQQHSERYTL